MEVRAQKDRIRQSIEEGKTLAIQAKQKAYQEVKEASSRTHLFKTTAMQGFFQQAQATYQWRMDAAVSQTQDMDQRLRELERQEAQMLNKLQQT